MSERRLREQRAELPPMTSSAVVLPSRRVNPQRRSPAPPPASPQQAGHHVGLHDESWPSTTAPQGCNDTDVASFWDEVAEQETVYDPPRLPTSSRRYQSPPGVPGPQQSRALTHGQPRQVVISRTHRPGEGQATRMQAQQTRALPHPVRRAHVPWLLWVGGTLLLCTLGWLALSWLVAWWQVTENDLEYGRPRTFQIDAVVGHHDDPAHPSHFIALNLHGRLEVIEFPGGDPTHARLFLGPTLLEDGADLVPVTLSFQDVDGDGTPDMLLHVQGSTMVFLNQQGTFRLAQPGTQTKSTRADRERSPR